MTKSPTNNKMPEFSQAHDGRRRGEMTRQPLRVKRVYQAPDTEDGVRVLVDRLWPRGLSRERAQIDLWLKEIAPSTALRKWFGHDLDRWQEFKKRYWRELDHQRDQVEKLARETSKRKITLLFGAKDTEHNNAVALKDYIEKLG